MAYCILLVEDEFIIAEMLSAAIKDEGHRVEGPYARVAPAVEAAENRPIDAAILDINLAGDLAYPVADRLADRGIPYVFLSAHDNHEMAPDRHKPAPAVRKPFEPEKIAQLISGLMDGRKT